MAVRRLIVLCSVVSAFQRSTYRSFSQQRSLERFRAELTIDEIPIASEVEPLHNYMLIKVASTVDATSGGVLLPEKAKEKPTEGIVVACGPGRIHPDTAFLMKTVIPVGSRVLYGKFDGTPLKYCGEDHQLIRDDDVLLAWQGEETLTIDNATPIRDRVLLKVTKAEDVTTTGIALAPGVAQQQKNFNRTSCKIGRRTTFFYGRSCSHAC
mmetsp:Transcript_22994/g.28657  ORF Transcript_22994/g.28657 Transcript_22994/m.28657 type:complete len:210 (-) Transcript_22994:408-1037(-)